MVGVSFADIEAAGDRLDDESVVKRTPVERSTSLGGMVDADVHLKMEHLQWTGSFKTRGAYNKLSQAVAADEVEHAVAASAGNHAQGVALAASTLGVDSTIVMPKTAPQTKIDATRGYGATVELHGKDFQAAMAHAQELAAGGDSTFVHAYDDPDIVAGQGTLGVEMVEDCPAVDTVIVPIGGGGLISGISLAFSELAPEVRIVGVQAQKAATVPESLDKGAPQTLEAVDTIADGIATGGVSDLTLGLIETHVDEIVTVSDGQIARAVLLLLERAKQLVEGAGAAGVAAMLSGDLDVRGETVMPLLCGGNLDMTMLRTVLVHALTDRRQLVHLRVRIDDVPGRMADISTLLSEHDANIRTVRHERAVEDLDVGEAYLVFRIETSGASHSRAITETIEDHGYTVEVVNAR
ncbi:threonine ammonia-lyase [Halalkalicoccus jeotgali]|uniref:threonine ammonia-lyase n=1 Tax=Halalkalicoccus jeotgali (strain DSM 18796 / CECT 7217 / JCM 14584 / KCTC 4019 / B3) TaxID=795797 RepID=D8J435_HALJB|nr:threonine ammonia-lyase [Halalkalicoccus jeotgali]ADJ15427.1 threonine dehydratase [Halalkalicoccus jeotgali B3]ELY35797.1 threonine dehydratase [Halalkalicoccus jeotgali B3]